MSEQNETRTTNQNDNDMYFINEEIDDSKPMGFFERIISIFIAPGKLGENLERYPKFGEAMLVILILSLCATFITMPLTELTLEAQSEALAGKYGVDFLNLQNTAAIIDTTSPIVIITGFIGSVVTYVTMAAFTAIGLIILTKIMRGPATFRHYFAVALHVAILSGVGGIIASGLMLATGSVMMFTSLAPILMPNGNFLMPMFNFLQSIELFAIWGTIVTIVCVKKINNFSTAKAVTIGIILFALSVGMTTAVTSSSAFIYDMSYQAIQQVQ